MSTYPHKTTLRFFINVAIFVPIYMFAEATDNKNMCVLNSGMMPLSYSREGDIILGGILQICFFCQEQKPGFSSPPLVPSCDGLTLNYLRHLLTFVYAIEEINNSSLLLPNATLGFQIYDGCTNELIALKSTLNILSGCDEPTPNYMCQNKNMVSAFIGHFLPSVTKAVASLTQVYRYPQISYGPIDLSRDEWIQFPSLYRTVPNELSQLIAVIHLLARFGWTWVGIIVSEEKSIQLPHKDIQKVILSSGICVAFQEVIMSSSMVTIEALAKTVKVIKHSSVNVIVVFCDTFQFINLMACLIDETMPGKVWIYSMTITFSNMNILDHFIHLINGSLLIYLHKNNVPGFKDFLYKTTRSTVPRNIFLDLFWNINFHDIPPNSHSDRILWRQFLARNGEDHVTYSIYIAVNVLAHAIHNMYINNPETEKLKVNDYLENVHIRAPEGEVIFSYEKGGPQSLFDIVNWVVFENGSLLKNPVGHFFSLTPEQLLINKSLVIWHPDFTQIPQSVCSESCPLGSRKAFQNGRPHCCFDCIPCSAGEIANMTGMDNCIRCPEDEWSNLSRTQCVKRLVDFLSYEDYLGIVLMCFSALFCTITAEVLWLFIKHRCSPIVKANNRNLSYVLLASIMVSFLCSFLFIGRPQDITCLLRQVMFGCTFSVVISSVLGKTLTVVLAFNASKPGSKLKKWLGSRMSISLVLFSSLVEVLICFTWLITAPPFVEYDTKMTPGMIIIQCNEGSIIALCFALTYIGALSLLSFMVAFMARKLPDTFNEAQYITFSMLVFFSVWISFIPTYLSTKGKYMVAVEVFAILTSTAGILGCIFVPKCYIIYFKPELNTKRLLMKIGARRI